MQSLLIFLQANYLEIPSNPSPVQNLSEDDIERLDDSSLEDEYGSGTL